MVCEVSLYVYTHIQTHNVNTFNPCYLSSQGVLILSLINFTPLKLDSYQYPGWAYTLGIFLSVSSLLPLPVWEIYILTVAPGTPNQVKPALMTPQVLVSC